LNHEEFDPSRWYRPVAWGLLPKSSQSALAEKPRKGLSAEVHGIIATSSRHAFGVDATQTIPVPS